MSVFKNEEEKEYVMAQLCQTNRPEDLANFFLLYNEVSSEDIFEFYYMTPKRFYIELFERVMGLLIYETTRGNFMKYAGNILQGIYLDDFYKFKKIKPEDYKNKEAILSVFIRDLLTFLTENSYRAELSFAVATLADNPNFSKEALKSILKSDISFNSQFIVEDLLDTFILDIEDIIDVIEFRFEFTTNEEVLDLFRKLYTTEENLISILEVVKSKYDFVEKRLGRIKVVPKTKGRSRRFYELIREFLTEVIVAEAEVDIWEYLQHAESSYMNSKELYYLDIFNKVKSFINSKDRREHMVNMFNIHGHEEHKNLLTYDEIVCMNNELYTSRYVYQLEYIEPFRFFIRLFNINRFGFLSYDRAIGEIRELIASRMIDVDVSLLKAAIDKKTYNLLINY